jgi:hypothetical protein
LQSDIGPYSTVAKDNDFAKKDKNNSKEHGALAKIGNMLFCSRRGWRPSISNRVPRDPAVPLDLQKPCCLLKLRQFWQKTITAAISFSGP